MPGRPFQCVRNRLAAGSALRAPPRALRPSGSSGRTHRTCADPQTGRGRLSPPPKKNNRPAAPAWKTDRLPSAQGADPSGLMPFFSQPSDAQKRVCGGIAAQSRRCGGAASQLYDQFRHHFAINRLRCKRHKPQRRSPKRRTGEGSSPPLHSRRLSPGAARAIIRPGPARSRPGPIPPQDRPAKVARPFQA